MDAKRTIQIEEGLRTALRLRASEVTMSPALRGRLQRRLRREPRRLVTVTAVALAAVMAVSVPARSWLGELRDDRAGPVRAEGWRALAPSPLSPRSNPIAVWTGSKMLVWGGSVSAEVAPGVRDIDLAADGAAYDPARDRWERIATAPMDASIRTAPRMEASAWTGRELLVWAGPAYGGTAYDPASDTWRNLPPSPLSGPRSAFAAWTGRELLVWSGRTRSGGSPSGYAEGAAYDPASNAWRRLPVAPRVLREANDHTAVWAGSQLVVIGRTGHGCAAAAYDPEADGWRQIDGCPRSVEQHLLLDPIWTGTEVLFVATPEVADAWLGRQRPVVAAYAPATDTWRQPAAMPAVLDAGVEFVWTGSELLFVASTRMGLKHIGRSAGYDPLLDRWRRLPDAPEARTAAAAVWTGSEALFWGGINTSGRCDPSGCGVADGMAYRPAG
jgi:hypothetical protein